MPSDISRLTFDRKKHYSGVRMQQGRVLLDADWNEQVDIEQYRTQTQTKDLIGQTGVPKGNDGFIISRIEEDELEIEINSGHIYVGGLLCELEEDVNYNSQPYYPNPDPLSFLSTDDENPGLIDGNYLVYLEAWQREVTAVDDPSIKEVALGGMDTTTRLQTVWQVRLLALENDLATLNDPNFWAQQIPPPNGEIQAFLDPEMELDNLGNQLYRVEVHNSGGRETATFKWSRDNASIETKILNLTGNALLLENLEPNGILGFTAGQWVEIVDEASSLNGSPYALHQIISINPDRREVLLNAPPAIEFDENQNSPIKLRGWDQGGTSGSTGMAMDSEAIILEHGLKIQFSEGQYRSGDHWLIPTRHTTTSIEWPSAPNDPNEPLKQPPHGYQRHRAKLALIKIAAGDMVMEDIRNTFPALTHIEAEDVHYDNTKWPNVEAENVQEAIDELSQLEVEEVCLVVAPGSDWAEVFNQIPTGGDAKICFQVGEYPLEEGIVVEKKGNLQLVGCGLGTRMMGEGELCIRFEDCASVHLSDLYAEAKAINITGDGVITFSGCENINVENIELKRGGDTWSNVTGTSACLTDLGGSNMVRIHNSKFSVDNLQKGLSIFHARKYSIENNQFCAITPTDETNTITGSVAIYMGYSRGAGNINIRNNSINRFASGIFVDNDGELATTDKLTIVGNTFHLVQPASTVNFLQTGIRIHHIGVLLIENNTILLKRLSSQTEGANNAPVEGVFVGGLLGNSVLITQNNISSIDGNVSNGFTKGIIINHSNDPSPRDLWAVTWNIAFGKDDDSHYVFGGTRFIQNNIPLYGTING